MRSPQLGELDGAELITRSVHAAVPPREDYAITMLGQSALPPINGLRSWDAAYCTARDPGRQPTLDGPGCECAHSRRPYSKRVAARPMGNSRR